MCVSVTDMLTYVSKYCKTVLLMGAGNGFAEQRSDFSEVIVFFGAAMPTQNLLIVEIAGRQSSLNLPIPVRLF